MTLKEKRFVPIIETKGDSIDTEKRTLRAVVNSNAKDRDGEVIPPAAFKDRIETYLKNPVMLWMHNPTLPPIGKATDIEFFDDRLEKTFQFREEGKSDLADEVFGAYAEGVLRSFSVGFRVHKMAPAELDEDGNEKTPPTLLDGELFETSAVTIPANTEAVAKMVQRAKLFDEALSVWPGSKHIKSPEGNKFLAKASEPWSAVTPLQILEKAPDLVEEVLARIAKEHPIDDAERIAIRRLRVSLLGTDSITSSTDDIEKGLQELSEFLAEQI